MPTIASFVLNCFQLIAWPFSALRSPLSVLLRSVILQVRDLMVARCFNLFSLKDHLVCISDSRLLILTAPL